MTAAHRIAELEEALLPFSRLCVADGRMAGLTPDGLRAAVAAARTVLASCDSHRMAETQSGSVRSMTGAVGSEADETPKGGRQ